MLRGREVVPNPLLEETAYQLITSASTNLTERFLQELEKAKEKGSTERERWVLEQLVENARIARREKVPLCQDTGYVIFFLRVGEDICLERGYEKVLNEAVRRCAREGFLRASMVSHPIRRVNTGDNTPALIHIEPSSTRGLGMDVLLKGGGSENAGAVRMLSPAEGEEGVVNFVVEAVREKGADACPPLVLGIGVGGTMEECCFLSKKALLNWAKGKEMGDLERKIMKKVSELGIGAGGVGGAVTCLGVSIEWAPCHIATLPVALSVQCNAFRFASVQLELED